MSDIADSIPVVGHVKGSIHYIFGDRESGHNAMKSASRTAFVAGVGVSGFIVGGPPGAVAGGMAGGFMADSLITGIDSAVEGKYMPYGHLNNLQRALNGDLDAGSAFDWAVTPIFDGLAGRGFGKLYQNLRSARLAAQNFREEIQQAVQNGDITLREEETVTSLAREIQKAAKELKKAVKAGGQGVKGQKVVGTMIIDVEGNSHMGYSYRLRSAMNIDAFEGDVPSAQQILENRLPGRAPIMRGASVGEAQCAEIHGLHQFHRVHGLEGTPSKSITIKFDGTRFTTRTRCNNCAHVGRYVNMGDVICDGIGKLEVPLENASIPLATDLLVAEGIESCHCEGGEERDNFKKDD